MHDKRWTDKQLANALRHPHAQPVKRWLSEDEDKHRAISIENLAKIAKALGVAVKALDPTGTEAYDPSNRPPEKRRRRPADISVRPSAHDRLPLKPPDQGRANLVFPNDPLLTALVQAWPWLAEDVRRDIAQKVIASTPTTPTSTPLGSATLPKVGG